MTNNTQAQLEADKKLLQEFSWVLSSYEYDNDEEILCKTKELRNLLAAQARVTKAEMEEGAHNLAGKVAGILASRIVTAIKDEMTILQLDQSLESSGGQKVLPQEIARVKRIWQAIKSVIPDNQNELEQRYTMLAED